MKKLYEDENIVVSETGHDYDFIGTIENKANKTVTVVFDGEYEPVESCIIPSNDWIGILADEYGSVIMDALKSKSFHISFGNSRL